MRTFLTVVITIICWQLICVITDIVTDDDHEKVGLFAFGIWVPVCILIGNIAEKIRLASSRKYNFYQLFGNIRNKNNSMGGWITNVFMTKEVADKYFIRQFGKDDEVTQSYSIRLLREGKEFKSVPYKSDILTANMIEDENGTDGMSFSFLKKFREDLPSLELEQ